MADLSFGIVALGANLPLPGQDPAETLRGALGRLQDVPQIRVSAVSRIWRTPAVPAGAGPDYANSVALIRTEMPAPDLLAVLHGIETDHGRDRSGGRWSARVLDLDLIALDDLILPDADHLRAWMDLPPDRQRVLTPDRLILPHPRLQDRAFVLAPLAEIAPDWRHPLTGRSVVQMRDDLGPQALAGLVPMSGTDLPVQP